MNLINENTGGILSLLIDEKEFKQDFNTTKNNSILTIAWNKGADQEINIDGNSLILPNDGIVFISYNQYFNFSKSEDLIIWQFNQPFYCIVSYDSEVSCAGLLFYGTNKQPIIKLTEEESNKIELLYKVFLDEFQEDDHLKEGMLRTLINRLIILTTRIYKDQNELKDVRKDDLSIIQQFNLLVEDHYKELHKVKDYADKLNKSPKTISNIFSLYSSESPIRVIHNRIILEAKRMLLFTDLTIKEIAYELGFEEAPSFNRLFKQISGDSPSNFKKNQSFST